MADVVARLKLDNKDYKKKIDEAKKSTKKFSQEGGKGIGEMMDKFKALAAAVAACKLVQDGFNAVINSSQTLADGYANKMASVKGVLDNIAYSVVNADFSSFERGLRAVADASWAASAALDQLWNTKQSASYFTAKNRAQLAELLNTVKDQSKSAEQRKQAQEMIDALIKDQQEVVATTRQDVDKAIFAMVNQAAGGKLKEGAVNKAVIEETLRIDVSVDRDELKKQIEDGYAEYLKESKKIAAQYTETSTTMSGFGGGTVTTSYITKEGKAALAELDAKYADIIVKHATLEVMTDEELAKLIEELNYAEQQSKIMEKMVAQRVAITNQMTAANAQAATTLATEQQITAEYQKRDLKMTSIGDAGSVSSVTSLPAAEAEPKTYGGLVLPDKIEMPKAVTENTDNLAQMTEQTYDAADAMNALSSTMSSLSSIVGEDAAAWLDWGMGVAQAVAQAIPQIAALTTAKTTEATANTASAATGAASSVASVPYVGPILAIAAVASVLAALANLPKFATGGIVPGANLSGDNVLIRANSQEMVLNREQQNILSKRLNGGMNGKVTFEIKGQKLVGILNNQNRINSQNYGG